MPDSVIKKLYFCPKKSNWYWLKTNNYKTDNIDEVTAFRHWKIGQPRLWSWIKENSQGESYWSDSLPRKVFLPTAPILLHLDGKYQRAVLLKGKQWCGRGPGGGKHGGEEKTAQSLGPECIRVHVGTVCWKLNFTSSAWNHVRGNP